MHAYGLSVEQQDELWQRWREGEALRSVARQLGTPVQKVRRYVAQTGGVRPRPAGRSARHLSLQEREEVSRGLAAGWSMRRIAAGLDRPPSTVSREVARNGGRDAYRAHDADAAAYERAQRPKPGKLRGSPRLLAAVLHGLELEWSSTACHQPFRRGSNGFCVGAGSLLPHNLTDEHRVRAVNGGAGVVGRAAAGVCWSGNRPQRQALRRYGQRESGGSTSWQERPPSVRSVTRVGG